MDGDLQDPPEFIPRRSTRGLRGQRVLQLFGFFTGLEAMGFTMIVAALLCMGGLQLIALGVDAQPDGVADANRAGP